MRTLFSLLVLWNQGAVKILPFKNREKKRQEVNGRGEYSERSSLNSSNESIGKTGSSQSKCAKFSRAEQIFDRNLKQKMTRTDAHPKS
jgi:hypothetical protein